MTDFDGNTIKIHLAAADTAVSGPVFFQVYDNVNNVSAFLNDYVAPSPAVPGSEMALVNGAITDAKISVPAEPTAPASTILAMIQQLWRRFFKRTTRSLTQIKTYKNDAVTVVTTQPYTAGGGSEDVGAAT